jgi:hypothetical protein
MYLNNQHMVRKVLDNHGSITKLEAMHLNVGNIYDVIMRLRNKGMLIETVSKVDERGRKYTKWVKRVA